MSQHKGYKVCVGDRRHTVWEGIWVESEAGVKHTKQTKRRSKRMRATVAWAFAKAGPGYLYDGRVHSDSLCYTEREQGVVHKVHDTRM